jgi:hypothetical protein
MTDHFASLTVLLSEVILPNLQVVQMSQVEQIAANDRIEKAIQALRAHLDTQFALLNAQLVACQAELAATQAALKATQNQAAVRSADSKLLIN